jgi:hypothetical protein
MVAPAGRLEARAAVGSPGAIETLEAGAWADPPAPLTTGAVAEATEAEAADWLCATAPLSAASSREAL